MTQQSARLGDPNVHFWLTRSMARMMGVSFTEAMASGALTPKQYADLVTCCRGCPHVAACQKWLGEQSGGMVPEAPEFCSHAAMLERLAKAA